MSSVAKYGKFMHLEMATLYKRADLAAAQQDDELKKNSLMPPSTMIGIPTSTGMHYTAPLGRVKRTMQIRQNFYISSLTKCVDDSEPRFSAFADARLMIHDPLAFGKRVCEAAQVACPNWLEFFAPVHYFDPNVGHPDYLPSDPPDMQDSLPWRLKEDSYTWQQEWRFIWLPDTELVGELPPIELAIGSLSDIAVLERWKPKADSPPYL
jgi:hypothetical protein